MKKLICIVVVCCGLLFPGINAFAENDVFALKSGEDVVYCFQYESDLSFFVTFPFSIDGYRDFGNSVLFAGEGNLLFFGRQSFSDFLSSGKIKKLSDKEKLEEYFKWEKKYQEKEHDVIFKDGLKIVEKKGKLYGYYKFYRKVDPAEMKPSETVAIEGIAFIHEDYIIYVNKMISKAQSDDEDASRKLLQTAYESLKVTSKKFNPEDGWNVYLGL